MKLSGGFSVDTRSRIRVTETNQQQPIRKKRGVGKTPKGTVCVSGAKGQSGVHEAQSSSPGIIIRRKKPGGEKKAH